MTPNPSASSILLRALADLEGSIVRPLSLRVRAESFDARIVIRPRAGSVSAPPSSKSKLIEQCIIEALGGKTMFAKEIAKEAGYADSRHFRDTLRKLESEGRITKGPTGYRLVELDRSPSVNACCTRLEAQPCVDCAPGGKKSIIDWQPPSSVNAERKAVTS